MGPFFPIWDPSLLGPVLWDQYSRYDTTGPILGPVINNTWIMLENIKNGTLYNVYVTATELNLTSENAKTIPFLPFEDMTGLPEPVITLEPSSKNGVFSPDDQISVKCSLPPNTRMKWMTIQLSVGSQEVRTKDEATWVALRTTVEESVNTAKCRISYSADDIAGGPIGLTRTATRSWTVLPGLETEFAQRRQEEMAADRARMDFRKI